MRQESFLTQPVGAAACRIALAQLDAARTARERLNDAGDKDALHDFRVALRRMRSVLRAYRPWLNGVPRKRRRRLRALARATNAARDAEVMLGWLRQERRKFAVRERAGYLWLREFLERRREEAYAEVAREVAREFGKLDLRLREALERMGSSGPETTPQPRYAVITAELIRRHTAEIAERLSGIQSVEDAQAIHATRIRGKRLRYLLEPLAAEVPAADVAIQRMKQFQDRFGVLCDAFVQARVLAQAVEIAGAEQAQRRPARVLGVRHTSHVTGRVRRGLLTLGVRLQAETQRRYAAIARHYLDGRSSRLLGGIESLAETLAGRVA